MKYLIISLQHMECVEVREYHTDMTADHEMYTFDSVTDAQSWLKIEGLEQCQYCIVQEVAVYEVLYKRTLVVPDKATE